MTGAESMVRVGVVSATNRGEGKARVYYPDRQDMVSDWLYVLAHKHQHDGVEEADWFPKVNQRVLVLYPCGMNPDGYILGVIP